MTLKSKLSKALNEKDVENTYRNELSTLNDSQITSPYGGDGLFETKNIRSLLEFKYDLSLKNKLHQCNVLIQCLYYIKKYEVNGDKLPTTIFVGDINECFAIHTNSIVKYLSSDIDWKIAPSEAYMKNPELIQAMVNDINILPFVHDIDDNFHIKTMIETIKELSDNVIRKVRVTKHNIVSIFDYFDKNVLGDVKLSTNEKANLFIQIIINPNENCLHPKRKNVLITKSFGDIKVNQNLFNSFFQHFEGDIYSPKEKEGLTGLVDRLIEDSTRRSKGEFFTPTPFVDLAHKYIDETFGYDWKEKYIVWDCAWGTGNLTRDYKFKELYCSTLEQSDIDTANQMGYNPEAVKFQYDFLNDGDDKLPVSLLNAINSGKEILFLINPPYATGGEMGSNIKHKKDVAKNKQNELMLGEKMGKASMNLYAQFIYKIIKLQQTNKNIKLAVFSPPLFLSGSSFKNFRELLYNNFSFKSGFLLNACNFSDVAKGWGISLTIFDNIIHKNNNILLDVVDIDQLADIKVEGQKCMYNTDNKLNGNDYCSIKSVKKIKVPLLTSAIKVKNSISKNEVTVDLNYIGYLDSKSNNVYYNNTRVGLYSSAFSDTCGTSITKENILKVTTLFTARKSIQPNWINCKDEYLAPNEQHPDYEQFSYDSIVYSLFNNSSQQSSLRQVEYKEKLWDIKNEFFWLSKETIKGWANDNQYDELYKDAKNGEERFIYKKLFQDSIYDKLSTDAKQVLDMASELLRKSIQMRKIVSEEHPEYHLDTFDSGYAQLKLVWKQYYKEEFDKFRKQYKSLEDRLRPMVYELGFLRK